MINFIIKVQECIQYTLALSLSFILITSCNQDAHQGEKKINYVDSFEINSNSLTRIHILQSATNDDIIIIDTENRKLHRFNKNKELIKVEDLMLTEIDNRTVALNAIGNNYLVSTIDGNVFLIDSLFTTIVKSYSLPQQANISNLILGNLHQKKNPNLFLSLLIPNLYLIDSAQFVTYYNSKILSIMCINDDKDSAMLLKHFTEIGFPEIYKKEFYSDPHIISLLSEDTTVYYTFKHWDSIGIATLDGAIRHLSIPEKYSVKSPHIPKNKMADKSYLMKYEIVHDQNIFLFEWNEKILLFQFTGIEHIKEDGTMNTYFSKPTRILIFDKLTKKFEDQSYNLPSGFNPIKSVIIENKLFIPQLKSNNKIMIYEMDL